MNALFGYYERPIRLIAREVAHPYYSHSHLRRGGTEAGVIHVSLRDHSPIFRR